MTDLLKMGELQDDEVSESIPEISRTYPSDVETPVVEPGTWYVTLLCYRPKTESKGGIAFADSTQEAQNVFQSIGKVIYVGPLAYKGTTNSGLSMADGRVPKVGEYWAYPRHAGQPYPLRARYEGGIKAIQLVLKDTELLGFVPDPDAIRTWVDS